MPNLESWKKRYTVREFDTERIPSTEQINHITECLNFLPIQKTDNNSCFPNHLVLMLTPNDTELKKFLVMNFFHDPEKVEHFTSLYESPYLFLVTDILRYYDKFKKHKSVEKDTIVFTHAGLTTGVVISQAIEIGLDVCQIACRNSDEDINQQISELLNNRFVEQTSLLSKIHNVDFKIGEILIGIGVGFGKPLSTNRKKIDHTALGVKYFSALKLEKKQPFMFIK